jgi:hypothetical protein
VEGKTVHVATNGSLSSLERDILATLAQNPNGLNSVQVALRVEKSHTSGHYNNTLGKLRSSGYIEGMNNHMRITHAGNEAIGPVAPLPTGEALLQQWVHKLDRLSGQILTYLSAQYPNSASKEQVADALGYSAASGHFNNTLGKLRTLGVIVGANAAVRATEDFFN